MIIATPDHTHAPIALAAMALGKHVYVQKPLSWSVEEARALRKKAAENPKIATQMGNQGHSLRRRAARRSSTSRPARSATSRKCTSGPTGRSPTGRRASRARAATTVDGHAGLRRAGVTQPARRRDGWRLRRCRRSSPGICSSAPAPQVPYHPVYHPFNWRGWVDWGQGALGDMGAHLVDHPFWALDLGMPTTIETMSTPFNERLATRRRRRPYYEFAARGRQAGGEADVVRRRLLPPQAGGARRREARTRAAACMFVGSKGKLMHDTYGDNPRLLPQVAARQRRRRRRRRCRASRRPTR